MPRKSPSERAATLAAMRRIDPTRFAEELRGALRAEGGNRRAAAKRLGVHYNTLLNWLAATPAASLEGDDKASS